MPTTADLADAVTGHAPETAPSKRAVTGAAELVVSGYLKHWFEPGPGVRRDLRHDEAYEAARLTAQPVPTNAPRSTPVWTTSDDAPRSSPQLPVDPWREGHDPWGITGGHPLRRRQ